MGSKIKRMDKDSFLKKYGHIKVRFHSYFKADFSFVGDVDGASIYVHVGGDLSDIYELDVSANEDYRISDLDINFGYLQNNNGGVYDSFNC